MFALNWLRSGRNVEIPITDNVKAALAENGGKGPVQRVSIQREKGLDHYAEFLF